MNTVPALHYIEHLIISILGKPTLQHLSTGLNSTLYNTPIKCLRLVNKQVTKALQTTGTSIWANVLRNKTLISGCSP